MNTGAGAGCDGQVLVSHDLLGFFLGKTPKFVRRYAEEIPGYLERLQVKPGLTGLAQVNGGYHTSPAYKLKYDLAYIYNYSVTLDLKIMAETVKVMVTRRGV